MPPKKPMPSVAAPISPKSGKNLGAQANKLSGKISSKTEITNEAQDPLFVVPSTAVFETMSIVESKDDPLEIVSKSELFLTFLQNNGVRMAFVRSLVALYEEDEKPDEPLPYICGLLGKGLPTEEELFEKQKEVEQLRSIFMELQEENGLLRYRLSKYTLPENPGEGGEDFDFGFEFDYDPKNYSYLSIKSLRNEEEEENINTASNEGDNVETPTSSKSEEPAI